MKLSIDSDAKTITRESVRRGRAQQGSVQVGRPLIQHREGSWTTVFGLASPRYPLIGTNATLIPNVTIGRWATIGAGAVVTKEPDYATVIGNPARVIRVSEPVHEHGRILQGEDG